MSEMHWVRGFFGALVLASVFGFAAFGSAVPAFAQQIVVEGASGIDPSTLKPYFTGTDPAAHPARRR